MVTSGSQLRSIGAAQLTICADRPALEGRALCHPHRAYDKSPTRAQCRLVALSVSEPRDGVISTPSARPPHPCPKEEGDADILWPSCRHECPTQHGTSIHAGPVAVAPFRTLAPKKKVVVLWDCCQCGHGNIPIQRDFCNRCGYPRCAYCPVSRVKTRPHQSGGQTSPPVAWGSEAEESDSEPEGDGDLARVT